MTHDDMKTVAYYAQCAYSTANKRKMNSSQWLKVRDMARDKKSVASFIKNLQIKNQLQKSWSQDWQ